MPYFIFSKLFGDRKRFGLIADVKDPDWTEWGKRYLDFYNQNQKQGIGQPINESGYKVLKQIDLKSKKILEIGPGSMPHLKYLTPEISEYCAVDINEDMLKLTDERLTEKNIQHKCIQVDKMSRTLPFPKESFDIIISFYSLEHLYPLEPFIEEMHRVLKPKGKLVGAIPSEGGLAWGLGRFFTSRRWFLKNTKINPDKIICWEHPNFAHEIVKKISLKFNRQRIIFWPFKFIGSYDFNLIVKFVFEKRS
jgi:ubiquinone/menaquinone biosynthesis C-methylase UbiE